MTSHSEVTKHVEEQFSITQKENSIYYELNKPKYLKAIKISDDLYTATFYFFDVKCKQNKQSDEFTEEQIRIREIVSSAVNPPLPEIGYVATCAEYVEIYGMEDYSVMASCNRDHIKDTVCISEQLHPLEWILTKARNSGILTNELYERIRIDVRHRAEQLQHISSANQTAHLQMLREVSLKYSPDANFKHITTSSDTDEFAGQIIAYLSNSYYFSNGDGAITFPAEVSGHKVRFAQIDQHRSDWQGGESGYHMQCFMKPEAGGSAHALINSLINRDAVLAMRLATAQELEFLKLTVELDQGRLDYRNKKKDIKMLAEKIAHHQIKNLSNLSQFSIFTPRSSATIPHFTSHVSGTVDWTRESENTDKISKRP